MSIARTVAALGLAGVLAGSGRAQDPPALRNPFRDTGGNHAIPVRVLVLNFDPRVPSEGGRRLHLVFGWNDPHALAAEYQRSLETAAGGAVRFHIADWRDLDEIYAQKDGFRYEIEDYVRFRRAGKGWHEGSEADYPRLLREQGVPALVDSGAVDEVWIFGDHYFGLWEASMAGPGAFFINGGVYPDVKTRRPFAFYGFNYERGVAEMLHNTAHRTEATLNRAFGEWKLQNPKNDWELFSANEHQSLGVAGVGTCHWPANAEKDYDYANPRAVESFAEDFLAYPRLRRVTRPVTAATWTRSRDAHADYMRWYFTLLPRAPGEKGGRQNNWFKYVFDFANYQALGRPQAARAWLLSSEPAPGGGRVVQVAYSAPNGVSAASLGRDDLEVAGSAARTSFLGASSEEDTPYLAARYRVTGAAAGSGLSLKPGAVRDADGGRFPGTRFGASAG